MEEINRNTRTLIVSFTVAVMAMIPLRFVEVGNQLEVIDSRSMVLGETSQEAVLPKSELESPYNVIDAVGVVEIENEDCLTEADAAVLIREISSEMVGEEVASDQVDGYLSEIRLIKESVCR